MGIYVITGGTTGIGAIVREQLLEQVWGYDYFGDSRTVDVHVSRLRDRFSANPDFQIVTVRGLGYKAVKKL